MLVRTTALGRRLPRLPPRSGRRLSSIPDWLVDPPPAPKHQLPLLAIVGTPNVGKSTLVNRLCRDDASWSALRQPALVSPKAGTTRDRLEYRCEWENTHFRVWDTGGVVGLADTTKGRSALLKAMEAQVREASPNPKPNSNPNPNPKPNPNAGARGGAPGERGALHGRRPEGHDRRGRGALTLTLTLTPTLTLTLTLTVTLILTLTLTLTLTRCGRGARQDHA